MVGRREESFAPHVHVGVVVAPAHPVAGARRVQDSGRVTHGSVRDLEQAADERRTVLVGQRDGVLGWQLVATGRRVVGDERSRGLRVEPFAGVVLIGVGAFGQFGWRAGPWSASAVVAETVTHHDQGAVQCGADLLDRVEHEGHQLVRVDRGAGVVVVHEVSFLDTVTVASQ